MKSFSSYIFEKIWTIMLFTFSDTLGLSIDLNVLKRDSQPYSSLLYQHEGHLIANNTDIKNNTSVEAQLLAFINKSIELNVDLAATPEYCCPQSTIEHIINTETHWPKQSKLWAIGCESIRKDQLIEIRDKYTSDKVLVHFEEVIMQKNGSYLDPLIYLFIGTHDGKEKLVVLIQFKTSHMGVWGGGIIERDNLIEGETIYILRNSETSIHFLSLICSEAMVFESAMTPDIVDYLQWYDKSFLIYNPQLNPHPTHQRFSDFKKYVLKEEKRDLITLNWSNTSTIIPNLLLQNHSSRSSIIIKSSEVDISHNRIKYNHALGMYYFSLGNERHSFLLDSSIHAFHIQNPPVSIAGVLPEQRRKDGPRMINMYSFNVAKNDLLILDSGIKDVHIQYLLSVGCTSDFLNNPDNCIIEKEMLVSLTIGRVDKILGSSWNVISNLFAIQSNQQAEPNNRITFVEDNYTDNVQQRSKYIESITTLENEVLINPNLFPPCIRDLKNLQLKIGYNANSKNNNYKYNIIDHNNEEKITTICLLGNVPEDVIDYTFKNLRGMFDVDNNNKRRVVVFYRRGTSIHSKSDNDAAKIGVTNDYGDQSILK